MLHTLDEFQRNPKILRLNVAGQPVEWLKWQQAVCLYSRGLVLWSLGDAFLKIRGGTSKLSGESTLFELHSIIACEGRMHFQQNMLPPLTNPALFQRDQNLCMYCGNGFEDALLTRDHVVPSSRGGTDSWDNVVSACRKCNHRKGSRLVHECNMQLLALPYIPNLAEYLALTNSGRILGDQMEFLKPQFGKNSRWLH
ncbi:MAG: HNH endonuclease [Pseudomonadales bacterium]|nr:HNH endonuclease [Pseudomonadales bacterium]